MISPWHRMRPCNRMQDGSNLVTKTLLLPMSRTVLGYKHLIIQYQVLTVVTKLEVIYLM